MAVADVVVAGSKTLADVIITTAAAVADAITMAVVVVETTIITATVVADNSRSAISDLMILFGKSTSVDFFYASTTDNKKNHRFVLLHSYQQAIKLFL